MEILERSEPLLNPTFRVSNGAHEVLIGEECLLRFRTPTIAGEYGARVSFQRAGGGWTRVRLFWETPEEIHQPELSVEFDLALAPTFHWMPHLAPEGGFVAAQHVFRSPALIFARGNLGLAIVPDLGQVGRDPEAPWFLDLHAPERKAWLGLCQTRIEGHVGFKKREGMTLGPGSVEIAFFLAVYEGKEAPFNPWKPVADFLWTRWGHPLFAKGEPGRVPMDLYVKRTYDWAFGSWKDAVWQEFDLDGKRVGAPQFIVNVSQSPNYEGPWFQREVLSIWNQAWFSSLRSASGLARWARRTEDPRLSAKTAMTKELALAAPRKEGLFPSVIRTEIEEVVVEGKEVERPRPWSEAFWTNSNRCPRDHGVTEDWFHVLDSSWTALLMLRWHTEIEADPRLLDFARTYADKLLTLQDADGYFPGWLDPITLEPAPIMAQTPESALSATFLLKLSEVTGEAKYRPPALRALEALLSEPVPSGRWEDFETYWSCNGFGSKTMVGKKFPRNDMYKQNNFCIFWTAEALLAAYQTTAEERYLRWGLRTLDELSMCQQVWQPPFIHVPALGGFGVMNYDGEWNDSRQSLFAELFMDYYRTTGDPILFERGVAALKASFVMMYCPENPKQKKQWEKAHPFFGKEDYGFMMENYGHGGETSAEGLGIGEFTIYDWGNGAASEARNRIYDHYGDVYIDRARGRGFGIDSVSVNRTEGGWRLKNLSHRSREIKVVFEDGSSKVVKLVREAHVR